jgi:hypothetical protein
MKRSYENVFPCPICKQFNSAKVSKCRYCSSVFSEETKNREIKFQEQEDKQMRLNIQKHVLDISLGVFGWGLFFMLLSLFSVFFLNERVLLLSPIIMLIGLVYVTSSIYKIYREKK